MKTSRNKAAALRVPRRWRTPPPLTRGAESLEGMEILREVGGEVGVLLWQAYRNVMFWSTTDEGERGHLFSPRAGERRRAELDDARVPAELAGALDAVAAMLAAPDGTGGSDVADACTAIARWAEEQGHMNTALAYTQAASVASPRNARLALAVGQLARRRAELARAETWFRHTIMVARQIGDWEAYSRAYIALGNMFVARGNFPGAHRMHIKALRAARRKGMPQIQGMALHDLFVIADETGRDEQAEEYARQAFRAYGPTHPSLPSLAHDVAYFWMQRGHFQRAMEVFHALEAHLSTPRERLVLISNLARAAAGVSNRDLFRRAWTQVYRLSKESELQTVVPNALLELAFGAASLSEWDRAEQAGQESLELAQKFGQGKTRFRAEALLDSIRSGRAAQERVTVGRASPKGDALATDFVRSLGGMPAGAGV
ncbi:tetratricopeptide repeat protein [Longimicrobium sp.]|jgi:tetratricopeptide (TPR) repeat protein|uniref:tetratricopeptide repeat protein n=1 Tax=Longimicrobium sp. TaxID=2029185 RepID=UPI002F942E21